MSNVRNSQHLENTFTHIYMKHMNKIIVERLPMNSDECPIISLYNIHQVIIDCETDALQVLVAFVCPSDLQFRKTIPSF